MNYTLQNKIQNFYDRIIFPGIYSAESIVNYQTTWDNAFINFIIPVIDQDTRVLDVGCGSGLISNLIAYHKKCRVTAIDWAAGINYAQSISCVLNNRSVTWIKDDFYSNKINESYQVIICQGVLHHMPNWEANLNKIKTLLSPGGLLFLGVYHPFGKFLQKFVKNFYKNHLLKIDQIDNPFELSWTSNQVKKMCMPLHFIGKIPKYPNINYAFNGGLTLYKFQKLK